MRFRTKSGFSRRELVGEVLRSIRANLPWTIVLVTATAAISISVLLATSSDVRLIEQAWSAQLFAGHDVFSITNASQGDLDAGRCDQLRTVDGVKQAGGVESAVEVTSKTDPGHRYSLVTATPGYLPLAFPREILGFQASVLAGHTIGHDLGLSDGGAFGYSASSSPTWQELRVTHSALTSSRFEPLNDAVLVSEPPTGSVGECMVEATSGNGESVAAIANDWFAPESVRVVPVLQASDLNRNPAAELQSRVSQWFPLAAALVIFGGWLLNWWGRRGEFAIYRMLGIGKVNLTFLLVIETLLLVWLPASIGVVVAELLVAQQSSAIELPAIARDYASLMLVLTTLPLIGSLLISSLSAFDVAKGR